MALKALLSLQVESRVRVGEMSTRDGGMRGTPLGPYRRPLPRVLWGSWGESAFSYEQGTPVGEVSTRRLWAFRTGARKGRKGEMRAAGQPAPSCCQQA